MHQLADYLHRTLPARQGDRHDGRSRLRRRISAMTRPPDAEGHRGEIEEIRVEKEVAIKDQDFEKAAALRDTEKQAKEEVSTTILAEWRASKEETRSS